MKEFLKDAMICIGILLMIECLAWSVWIDKPGNFEKFINMMEKMK